MSRPPNPQEAQAAALAAEVAALRCSESRLSAEIGGLQAQLAEQRREAAEAKRALAEAREMEQERLVLEVYPLMRAQYILRAAAAPAGEEQGGWVGGGWFGLARAGVLGGFGGAAGEVALLTCLMQHSQQ